MNTGVRMRYYMDFVHVTPLAITRIMQAFPPVVNRLATPPPICLCTNQKRLLQFIQNPRKKQPLFGPPKRSHKPLLIKKRRASLSLYYTTLFSCQLVFPQVSKTSSERAGFRHVHATKIVPQRQTQGYIANDQNDKGGGARATAVGATPCSVQKRKRTKKERRVVGKRWAFSSSQRAKGF